MLFLLFLDLMRSLVALGMSFYAKHSYSQVGPLYLTSCSLTFFQNFGNFLGTRQFKRRYVMGKFLASPDLYGFMKLTGNVGFLLLNSSDYFHFNSIFSIEGLNSKRSCKGVFDFFTSFDFIKFSGRYGYWSLHFEIWSAIWLFPFVFGIS